MHYGKKGMRWGVRRDSNGGHTAEDLKRIKTSVDTTSVAVDSTKRTTEKIGRKKLEKELRKELETMSDSELKERVNRLNMEERYSSIMSGRYVNEGQSRASKMLDGAGTALAIGSSALTIMVAMKQLRG
jgi:hypothetical protein